MIIIIKYKNYTNRGKITMSIKFKLLAAMAALSLVLGACGKAEETASKPKVENKEKVSEKKEAEEKEKVEYADVFKEAITELEKAKEGKDVDFDKVTDLYNSNLKELVQKRDAEFEDTIDEKITAALSAGKDDSMDKVIVKQIFDKLMQKVFYTSIKHDFTEVTEKWGKTEEVNAELEEAKGYYAILKSTVEKRDAAYGTNLVSVNEDLLSSNGCTSKWICNKGCS
jgi:ABC-type glycerol-3-phosphate transport system substrate-binding protein